MLFSILGQRGGHLHAVPLRVHLGPQDLLPAERSGVCLIAAGSPGAPALAPVKLHRTTGATAGPWGPATGWPGQSRRAQPLLAPACARASDHTRAHRHEHTRVGGGGTRALNQDEGCADTGRVSAHQEEKRISALAAEVRRSGSSHGAGLGQWARGRVEGGGWRVAGGVGGAAQQPQGKGQSLGGARGGTRHTPTRPGSRVLSSLYT